MDIVDLWIAVPSVRSWAVPFGSSLVNLTAWIQDVGEGFTLKRLNIQMKAQASLLCATREAQLQDAIDNGYSHILMLDDDMVFPKDTVKRLLAHKKPIVAVNYVRKNAGHQVTAENMSGQPMESLTESGLEQALAVGFGIVLIDLNAIKHIPAPHFATPWDTKRGGYWGEDYFFCGLMKKHGVEIFVDHDLSNEVSHCGEALYGIGGIHENS